MGGGQRQQDGGRIEQQRHDQDEIPHCGLVGRTKQGREIPHRSQVGLDGLPLAVHLGLLDAEICERILRSLALMDERRARGSLIADRGGLGVPLGGDGLGLVELGNARLDVPATTNAARVSSSRIMSRGNLATAFATQLLGTGWDRPA